MLKFKQYKKEVISDVNPMIIGNYTPLSLIQIVQPDTLVKDAERSSY